MPNNSDIKLHVSEIERARWDQVVEDLRNHIGAGGVTNHKLGDGVVAGFSMNDYTNREKTKLAGIEDGALNNPHPATHDYTMITGLHQVAHTGDYNHLINRPTTLPASGGNADTVGGIRITINTAPPNSPVNNREIWIDLNNLLIKTYNNNAWKSLHTVYA